MWTIPFVIGLFIIGCWIVASEIKAKRAEEYLYVGKSVKLKKGLAYFGLAQGVRYKVTNEKYFTTLDGVVHRAVEITDDMGWPMWISIELMDVV